MSRVAVFGLLLFLIQMLEGSALYFATGTLAFIVIAAFAFNTAGGFSRASGAYVAFYAILDFIIGVCYKAFLGEPAEKNLGDPHTTISVYVGGICGIFIAVLISRRISRRTGILENILPNNQMYRSCVGCILFALGGPIMIGMLGSAGARLQTAFTQLNELLPLSIIIGTMYEVRRSGGTRSLNLPVVFALIHTFLIFGMFGFSKQGMLLPLYCWGIAICATRYRLSQLQAVGVGLWVFLVFWFLVPYSQYGRRSVNADTDLSARVAISERLLAHPTAVLKGYKQLEEGGADSAWYYDKPEGFWDRLNFISVDDHLNAVTDNGHVFGYLPVEYSFINAIPHVFYPNKPTYNFGNMYAHEFGELPDEDTTTGISFSPSGELYHLDKWRALLIVGPLLWALLFVVFDSLCGDLRKTPWGLLAVALLSHAAPETGIEGCVYMATFGSEILIFCAVFATYGAPAVASVFLGSRAADAPKFQPRFNTANSATTMTRQEGAV